MPFGAIFYGVVGALSEAEVLSDIRERLVRVETKIDAMSDVKETATEAKETANKALQSTQSAHHRIDDLADKRIAAIEDNQRWLWRTIVGGIIAAVIAAVAKFKGG
jgi:hypothetical protein